VTPRRGPSRRATGHDPIRASPDGKIAGLITFAPAVDKPWPPAARRPHCSERSSASRSNSKRHQARGHCAGRLGA
jgi:hypothetical protein